jgi:hypothetical protein
MVFGKLWVAITVFGKLWVGVTAFGKTMDYYNCVLKNCGLV